MTKGEEQIRRKEIHQLLDLVLDINGIECRSNEYVGSKPTAFFCFFGNVCGADVEVHSGGWRDGNKPDYGSSVYFDSLHDQKKVTKAITDLTALRDRLANPSWQKK